MSGNIPRITEGRELYGLFPHDSDNYWVLHYILVMKEAALDFAKRGELPAPSWWTSIADAPAKFSIAGSTLAPPIAKLEPRTLGKARAFGGIWRNTIQERFQTQGTARGKL